MQQARHIRGVRWPESCLYRFRRCVQAFARHLNAHAQFRFCGTRCSTAFQTRELNFIAKKAVSEFIESGWPTAPRHDFPVEGLAPGFRLNQRVSNTLVVRCAFDGVSDRGEENVRVRALDVLDGCFYVL